MTFPLGRPADGPGIVRRPERQTFPAARIFSRVDLAQPGAVREISVTSDRLHLRRLVHGRVTRAFRFEARDLPALVRALRVVDLPALAQVCELKLKTGEIIQIGAGGGSLALRLIRDGAPILKSHIRLSGAELLSFAEAIRALAERVP